MKFFLLAGAVLALLCCPLLADQFSDAVAAFQKGDAGSAEHILRELLNSRPNDAAVLGLLGATLDTEKKYEEAGALYRHALRLSPHSANLLNNYANHQLATGDVAGARASYQKVVAIDPSHANANLQLAAIAVQNRKGAEALGYLQRVNPGELTDPQAQILEMQALYLADRQAEAAHVFDAILSNSDPRIAFSAGLAIASIGRYEQAETLFSHVLNAAPSDFDVLYNLGLAAYHAHHLEHAKDALETALAQRSNDVDTLSNLAAVYIDLENREKALELLAEASRLDPKRANVQLAIAQTTSALGYYADSAAAYDQYLKLNPNDASAKRERAFVLAITGDRAHGLAELRAFVRLHPRDATAYYEIGTLEAQLNAKDALVNLERAIALQPDFAPARFGRGVTNFISGNAAAALPDLQFSAERYPQNPTVLDRLGEAYLALDRANESIAVLKHASAIAPNDAKILMHLSRAYAKAGQNEDARIALARFRAVGSRDVNRVPAPGIVEFLSLSPEQQQARYRQAVEKRLKDNPQDASLNLRYLKLLLDAGDVVQARTTAAAILALKPPVPTAAEAGQALVAAQLFADAKPLLEYALSAPGAPEARLDLAIARFYLEGPVPGLAELDRIPADQRTSGYFLTRSQMLNAAATPANSKQAQQ